MKRHQLAAVIAAVVLTTGGLLAYGNGPMNGQGCPEGKPGMGMMQKGGMDRGDGMIKRVLFSLDLSDAQKESIEKLMVERRYKMKSLRDEEGMPMEALSDAVSEKGFDKAAFIKKATARQEAALAIRADFMAKMIEVLDAKQRIALKEKLAQMPAKGMKRP